MAPKSDSANVRSTEKPERVLTRPDERIIIIAPVGHDAAAVAAMLNANGFQPETCDGPTEACRQIMGGAGALMLTEEALELPRVPDLFELLKGQPAWSELPLILLTRGGESRLARLLELAARAAGSVTLLERPIGTATLLRSVEVALRSRRRQYQVRDLFDEQGRKQHELNVLKDNLAAELEAMSQLHQIAVRTVQPGADFKELLQEIVAAAATITGTDKGTLQLLDPSGALQLIAHIGFQKPFLDFFDSVQDGPAPCAVAMREAKQIVIDDVTQYAALSGTRALEVELAAGVRAVQSTPIRSRQGRLLGMVSTHFGAAHRASERDLRFVDLLARQAADVIERHQVEDAQKRAEQALRRAMEFDEAVMTNMGEGLYTVDAQGQVTSMNPAAEKLFGWTLDELRGRNMHAMTHYKHPDGSPFPAEDCAGLQVLKQGRTLSEYEDVFIRKDGTFFDVVYSSSPLREGGKVTGLVVVFRDVSERKRAEETRARLAAIVESSEDAIISKDLNGVIASWNLGAERLFGYTAREAIGRPISLLIPPERLHEEPGILERIRRGEPIEHYETVRRHKDGTLLDISLTVSPITDLQGRIVGASKIARDITHRKQAEQDVRESEARYRTLVAQVQEHAADLERKVTERTQDLRTINEQLEAFVYSIAHDLRAPLRSMIGYSQLLVDDYGSSLQETPRHLLNRIQASSEFMDKLLLDLLAYGRTARAEIELTGVNVRRIWEAAVFQCAVQIEQTQAEVEAVEPLPVVRAHEATLGQCVTNLLSNALKFVAPGVRPRVRCWAQHQGDYERICIADNGIGIPAEQHERAFRVFERLHGSRYLGTGIGLSIVRKGIERMGGRVGLDSTPGQGSCFWLELPKAN